jgi:hypothetical protein
VQPRLLGVLRRLGPPSLVELTGVDYRWGLDLLGEIFAALSGFAMPTTVYVAADGEIVATDNGAIDTSQLRDRLASLLDVEV